MSSSLDRATSGFTEKPGRPTGRGVFGETSRIRRTNLIDRRPVLASRDSAPDSRKALKATSHLMRTAAVVASIVALIAGSTMVLGPPVSGQPPHDPIEIGSDLEFTPERGIRSGNGTAADPYVIADWRISTLTATGIYIHNTSVHFVIEGITIDGDLNNWGIHIRNVTNGTISLCAISSTGAGIVLDSSSLCTVTSCQIESTIFEAILVRDSGYMSVVNCSIQNGLYGIAFDQSCQNMTVVGNTVDLSRQSGIFIRGGTDDCNFTFTENIVTRSSSHGLEMDMSVYDVIIQNNTFSWNGVSGVHCHTSGRSVPLTICGNTLIENGLAGIELDAYGCNVNNNTLSGNYYYGIYLVRGEQNDLSNNTMTDNGVFVDLRNSRNNTIMPNSVNGIPLLFLEDVHDYVVGNVSQVIACDSTNLTIRDLNMSRCTVAVEMYNTSYCTIDNITSFDSTWGVWLDGGCCYNVISDCRFVGIWEGIDLSMHSDHNLIVNNTVADKEAAGISLWIYVSNNTVTGNHVTNCSRGIEFTVACSDNTVTWNQVEACRLYGIFVYSGSNRNMIENNAIGAGNALGIQIEYYSHRNLIANNSIQGNTDGISITSFSDWTILVSNNLSGNAGRGLILSQAQNSSVSCNTITANNIGILMNDDSTDNWIYLNNFSDNVWNVYSLLVPGSNQWYSPVEVNYTYGGHNYTSYLGNYYDDYAGADLDANGIGDSPHPLDSEEDPYPLMSDPAGYQQEFIPEFSSLLIPLTGISVAVLICAMSRRGRTSVS